MSCQRVASEITPGEGRVGFALCCYRCPASDGSLKPGTQLKQTKASTELPLNPIKVDSSALSYVFI